MEKTDSLECSQDLIPELSDTAKNFLSMAKARDETVHGKGVEGNPHKSPCGKDTKAFWFLLGYGSGYYAKTKGENS